MICKGLPLWLSDQLSFYSIDVYDFFHPSWISAIGAEKKYSIDWEIDGICRVYIFEMYLILCSLILK